jgi:cell division protein FtsL
MMATAAMASPTARARRKPCWTGTPEVYFAKNIDNSRVARVADPKRTREMAMFVAAVSCLFLLVMTYAWQHFSAIEYGYRIEALQAQKAGLVEINRALRLEDASLRDPGRIDQLARHMGLQSPTAGQIIMLDAGTPDPSAPQMASVANPVAVVSAR